MKSRGWRSGLFSAASAFLLLWSVKGAESETVYDCNAEENRAVPTTIEITLARRLRDRVEEVKRSLAGSEAVKVRVRFFPFLDPPTNLGVGKCVSAEVARQAIAAAIRYNQGIERLIFQEILPHHWVKIGSTDTAELAWVAIGPEELNRLIDPSLSTDQFQDLYRSLATPKERKRPFGLGD